MYPDDVDEEINLDTDIEAVALNLRRADELERLEAFLQEIDV